MQRNDDVSARTVLPAPRPVLPADAGDGGGRRVADHDGDAPQLPGPDAFQRRDGVQDPEHPARVPGPGRRVPVVQPARRGADQGRPHHQHAQQDPAGFGQRGGREHGPSDEAAQDLGLGRAAWQVDQDDAGHTRRGPGVHPADLLPGRVLLPPVAVQLQALDVLRGLEGRRVRPARHPGHERPAGRRLPVVVPWAEWLARAALRLPHMRLQDGQGHARGVRRLDSETTRCGRHRARRRIRCVPEVGGRQRDRRRRWCTHDVRRQVGREGGWAPPDQHAAVGGPVRLLVCHAQPRSVPAPAVHRHLLPRQDGVGGPRRRAGDARRALDRRVSPAWHRILGQGRRGLVHGEELAAVRPQRGMHEQCCD
mmetsp:Transcript_8146/g.19267  ORF Transcript_8146/g.19267 Transcript_8146/m.19267 type:complete len:366 (+) Transcript_8146:1228-2325(+)